MADKDFKVKNKLFVNGLSQNSGVILATNNNLDSHTNVPTQYGGTGTTQSPNAGQVLYSSAGTNYAPTDLSSLTISSSGGSTITAASASTKGLIIKGAASQTANLQEWQNSSGAVVANISSDGNFQVYNRAATATNGSISVSGYYNGNYGILNLQANGFTAAELSGSRDGTKFWIRTYDGVSALQNFLKVEANRDATFYGNIIINSTVASSAGLMIKGATSQTANLQEWQNSSGTLMAAIKADGSFRAGGANGATKFLVDQFGTLSLGTDRNNTGTPTYLFVQSQASSDIGAVVKGASGQSVNLQEWQDSSGTILARVNSAGNIYTSGYLTAGVQSPTGTLTVVSKGVSVPVAVIKGAASQTANLQEWQNSSGTVLASISAAGNLTVQDLTVNGTTTTINSTTLTVDDKNIELASVSSPTDTTADGAGITIKGATDKTFNWVQSTGAFTSSEPISTPALSVSGNSVSSNITLAAGKRYFVDTTSARTLTLPASPTLADTIEIYDASGAAATNNITVNSNSGKINGTVQDLTVDTNGAAFSLVYTGSTYGWVVR